MAQCCLCSHGGIVRRAVSASDTGALATARPRAPRPAFKRTSAQPEPPAEARKRMLAATMLAFEQMRRDRDQP